MADRPTLIIGEEEFLADEALGRLIDQVLPTDNRALNLDVLDGAAPIGEILMRLDTAPFFGPARVVVVRRLEGMREADHDALIAYLERGDAPTVAIFLARDLDRRRRLFLTFRKVATIVECRPLPPRDLPAWIGARFKLAGKRAAPGAAESLATLSGGTLRALDHEVAKIALYVGERPVVTVEDVEAIATRLGEATMFTLVDAVGGRDAARALVALNDILSTHEPLQVLFMMARQFRLILRAHELGARGVPAATLGEHLAVHPYVARKIAGQARGYRPYQFPGIFAALEGADRAIKSGTPPRLALEMLIVGLCEAEPAARAARR
jgi:DNA polymerase-3 subunit delta